MNDHVNVFIRTLWTRHIFLCARFFLNLRGASSRHLSPSLCGSSGGFRWGGDPCEASSEGHSAEKLLKEMGPGLVCFRDTRSSYLYSSCISWISSYIYIFEFENEHHDHDDDDDDGDVQDGRIITENWRLDPPEIWDIQYREIVRLAVPCTRMSCLWPSVFGRNWRGHYNSPLRTVMRISPDFA